jgi:hypothetical protein
LENNGRGKQVAEILESIPDNLEIQRQLSPVLRLFESNVDSPRALLILRNSALTLLEVKEGFELERMFVLLADSEYRLGVVNRLINETPKYWDPAWYEAWGKDGEPLYSKRQQAIARRRSLINFWTEEWKEISEHEIRHAIEVLQSLK